MAKSFMFSEVRLSSIVHYVQEARSQPKAAPVGHGREIVEIVTGGRGWIQTGEEWLELQPGDLLWHYEGDRTISRSDPDDPYTCFAARFTKGLDIEGKLPRFSKWLDLAELWEFMERIIRLFLDQSFDRQTLANYLYSRLVFQVRWHHSQGLELEIPAPLKRILAHIENRFSERLKIGDLSKVSGWGEAHLHDQFRKYLASTPKQEILKRRIRSGQELLVSSGLSIKEIANRTGFTHSSAFCRAFKNAVGQSPKQYRETHFYEEGGLL